MTKLLNYIWIILLAIYIISPIDANPMFIDDLIAAGAMFYFLYKNTKQKQQQQKQYSDYYRESNTGSQSKQDSTAGPQGPLTLDKAYKILDVSTNASLDEISRAYKEKMTKTHPDKVSHLSEELQEKAKELTLELNAAYDLVKRYKKG